MVYLKRQTRWQSNRTALPPHLGLDFIRFTILATLVIILFSWTAPAVANTLPAAQKAWQPVQHLWNETRQRFDNAFASLRSTVGIVSQFYGASATLGRGNPLSDSQMFTVRAPDNFPPSVRLYWRARTYDTYENGQWFSTVNTVHNFDPQRDELPTPEAAGRWLGEFEFISATNIATLFVPPQPLWINQEGQVEYAENPDGTLDIATFRAVPSLDPGQVYQAQASVSYATQAQLNASGTEYPEWISERYLALPESVTPRTRQLAADITAGLETPYEKALAITDYLRRNMEYVVTIEEELPGDQEIIDWFLFDLRKGFCNYYSTAEVVLLRSLGIPARWSVGYAQGDRYFEQGDSPGDNVSVGSNFIIRQRDAHAWPEVYFAGLGWVEFEPTASQPDIARLPGETSDANEQESRRRK